MKPVEETFPWTAETEEICVAVIGEEGMSGLDAKYEVWAEEERGFNGRIEGDDAAGEWLKMGLGENGCGQRAKKSVKWAGWVWGGLIVMGQGWDIFVREKMEMGSRKTGLVVGIKSICALPFSVADNREDPNGDVAAKELMEEYVLLEEPKGFTPTWVQISCGWIWSCWGEDT
jgi:hypothetical protein